MYVDMKETEYTEYVKKKYFQETEKVQLACKYDAATYALRSYALRSFASWYYFLYVINTHYGSFYLDVIYSMSNPDILNLSFVSIKTKNLKL